jgi:threonine dehydrogenase-like Zn-dependent dehydrogenase
MTDGRGPDSVIDAVGMEAHGAPDRQARAPGDGPAAHAIAEKVMQKAGVDRLHALYLAIDIVRRGGTISLIGVYGGMADPLPMLTIFDKQIQLRMGQANVSAGAPTSCRCSPTATRSAWRASTPTRCRSRGAGPTSSSRRRRTEW